MRKQAVKIILCAGASLGLLAPALFASRFGLDGGYSGGPAGEGRNCSACHVFNEGPGQVELLGVPQRYRGGAFYDLIVRIGDPEQAGAGFQISAEGRNAHAGQLIVVDPIHTDFGAFGSNSKYMMHTETGVIDSVAEWGNNGGSYDYHLRWQAPETDASSITFFVSGNAINNAEFFVGDRFYSTHSTINYALPGDADGDGDADLNDFAVMQRCFLLDGTMSEEACAYVDLTRDDAVSLSDLADFVAAMVGPTAVLPANYVRADVVRGGQIFDQWWTVIGGQAPSGNHPLYPLDGPRAGAITFRCKECHGWDYKGLDGRYGSGSHATGIRGVFDTEKTAQEIFDLLQSNPTQQPNGHAMSAYGMTEGDLWDVVKWTREGVLDTNSYISADGAFFGDLQFGQFLFDTVCSSCHGFDGRSLNFGTDVSPEYVGTVAQVNPWEFLHLIRFGHPGTPMPALELLQWDVDLASDIGAYSETLPSE